MLKLRPVIWLPLTLLVSAGGAYFYHASVQRKLEQQIFPLVLSSRLKEDSTGTAELPRSYRSLSVDGKAYVVRRRDLTLVYLAQEIGGHADSHGKLLTSRPLVKADLADDGFGHSSILILMPNGMRSPNPSQQAYFTGLKSGSVLTTGNTRWVTIMIERR